MSIPYQQAHFTPPHDDADKRRLFKSSVQTVAIELTEHCNRRCTYCPVSIVQRLKNRTLPTHILDRTLLDLQEIDFDGSICLNLFNEPTSDRETLLDAISRIRTRLPKADVYFGTNGDYLNPAYLKELFDAGLSRLNITLHIPPQDQWDDVDAMNRFHAFSSRIKLPIEIDRFSPGLYIAGRLKFGGHNITIYSYNFHRVGSDRAGSMDTVEVNRERSAPCTRPFETVSIAFDGRLFPCCQFYPDLPENDRYSIGRLGDYKSIFDAYCSDALTGWRRSLFRYGPKESPCNTCLEADECGTTAQISSREWLAAGFGLLDDVSHLKLP